MIIMIIMISTWNNAIFATKSFVLRQLVVGCCKVFCNLIFAEFFLANSLILKVARIGEYRKQT